MKRDTIHEMLQAVDTADVPIFKKVVNNCSLLAFLYTKSFWNGFALERKSLLPKGDKSFLLEYLSFLE